MTPVSLFPYSIITKKRRKTPKTNMSNALEKEKIVKIGDKKVVVKKVSLRKIANLFKAIDGVPDEFLNETGAGEQSNAEFMRKLPELILELLPKYADLAAETLDNQVSGDEIVDADFDQIFDLVETFLEVNNIPKIMQRVGKVKALAVGTKMQEAIG